MLHAKTRFTHLFVSCRPSQEGPTSHCSSPILPEASLGLVLLEFDRRWLTLSTNFFSIGFGRQGKNVAVSMR